MVTATTTKPQSRTVAPPFLRSLFSLVHDMSAVQRFSRLRMVHPEHVLAHTGMVCVFVYAIVNRIAIKCPRALRPLNMGLAMSRAVTHDMDETITGDIVRPTKYFSDVLRNELGRLERKGVGSIADALELDQLFGDFASSKAGREGFIVKIADLLAALCTVYAEVCVSGNMAMIQPATPMRGILDTFEKALHTLGLFSHDETKVIEELLLEARRALDEIQARVNPLPSLHVEP